MINPYEPNRSELEPPRTHGSDPSLIGTFLITAVFALAALVGILSNMVPEIAAYTTPRFGAIGLVLCLNPLIFLVPTLRSPTMLNYASSAFMTLSIGLINAISLMGLGQSQSQSQWPYTVLPFLLAGMYLAWQSFKTSRGVKVPQDPPTGNDS
jgi:predicted neutral ceramidase superfamily lipid hydrolase